ncbi:MAG: 4Fe-4S dicluster domain-containing protein [Oscillospiraceae bacterium]|nr:4Fe-4S dicluster domain-containing protein [Oscillospiraceae bacterium]
MNDLTALLKDELLQHGADMVGIGDLSELPPDVRHDLTVGISVAVKYPDIVIQGIGEFPTGAYNNWYIKLNERLDMLVTLGAEKLQSLGYKAIAMTRAFVGNGETENNTALPHKTVATRAGIGWIGKSALLVTEQYGSMIRLSSILTDAPLDTAEPVNQSKCGDCMICTVACPAGAISGREWSTELSRDGFFDPGKCRKTAKERAFKGFGGGNTICGKCIEICPYTRQAWGNGL